MPSTELCSLTDDSYWRSHIDLNLPMDLSYKYLKPIFLPIMKATYYGQFVAGNTPEEIKNTTEELLELGIEPFIAMPIETESQTGLVS